MSEDMPDKGILRKNTWSLSSEANAPSPLSLTRLFISFWP